MAAIPIFQKIEGALQSRAWVGAGGPEEIAAYTVAWADLTGAGFVAGDDVMIFVRCFLGQHSLGASYIPINTVSHGPNFAGRSDFSDSLVSISSNTTSSTRLNQWVQIHRHTLIDGEGLFIGRANGAFNYTQYNSKFCMIVMGLDDLVEGTDFLFDEVAHVGNAPAAYNASGAEVTIPADGDDWFVIASVAWAQDDGTTETFSAINSGGVTVAEIRRIAKSQYENRYETPIHYLPAVGISTDVQVLYRSPSVVHDCRRTRILALRLDAFRDHQGVKSTTALTHSAKSTPQTLPASRYMHMAARALTRSSFSPPRSIRPRSKYQKRRSLSCSLTGPAGRRRPCFHRAVMFPWVGTILWG